MLSQGKLFALTLQKAQRGDDLLRLNVYATDTGDLVASHNLLHVRTSWQQRKLSRATQLADGLVATLGGFVVNVGFDGNVRWARRQTILPASQEPTWITQRFDRPLVSGGRTFIHTPGVRAVECLETDTGRLLWRQVIANIDRLIGIAGENLIVNHGEQLLALGKETGILAWSREMPNLLDAEFCSDEGILVARKVASQEDANQRLPRLVWLNPINGEVAARTNLMDLVHADPRIGPLLRHGDNVWTFWAGGADEPHRDLIQLQPQGEPDDVEDAVASVAVVNPWDANTQEELRAAVSNRFPEWTLLSAVQPDGFELVDDAHGEKNLVALPAYGSEPTVLGRELTVPKTGQPRLRLRVGNEPNHPWRLTVRLGEEVVMVKEMKWDAQPEAWQNVSVDLNTVAGQSGWLTVEARHVGGGDHVRTYWKQLDLQF